MPVTINATHSQSPPHVVAIQMSDAHFPSNRETSAAYGFSNSAELITAEIGFLLDQSPYRELRKMDVTVTKDEIELRGTVSSFYLKQVAQEIARKVAADRQIRNFLEVVC